MALGRPGNGVSGSVHSIRDQFRAGTGRICIVLCMSLFPFDLAAPFADMMYQDPATEVDGAVRCSEATTLRRLGVTRAPGQFLWMDTGSLADHGRGSAALGGSGCIRGEYKDIHSCSSTLLMFSANSSTCSHSFSRSSSMQFDYCWPFSPSLLQLSCHSTTNTPAIPAFPAGTILDHQITSP